MKLDEIYDEHDRKMQELQIRKKRRRRKWKIFRWSFFCMILVLGTLYFVSDYSKVKSLTVKNSTFYTEEEILNKAGLSYNTRYLLVPGFYISHKLENDPLIDSVDVSKNLDGAIIIQVNEIPVVGYLAEDGGKLKLLLTNGKTVNVDQKYLSSVVLYPQLDGFKKSQLPKIAKAFKGKNAQTTNAIISMISEIHPYSTNYDANMLQLVMQDGNRVYTSLKGVRLLDQYTKILAYLQGSHVCLFVDEDTNSIQKNKCP